MSLRELADSASSDFQIICGDQCYNVHRLVISIHSGYFKRLCEGSFQEATERKVTLHDDPPASVRRMVEWFYTCDYVLSPPTANTSVSKWTLEVNASMFTLADKYDIPNLKTYALARVQHYLANYPPDRSLDRHSQNVLAGTLHAFKNAPPTDDRLCKALVAGWVANDKALLRHTDKEDLESAMAETPEFASALVAELGGFALKTKGQVEIQAESGTRYANEGTNL